MAIKQSARSKMIVDIIALPSICHSWKMPSFQDLVNTDKCAHLWNGENSKT